MTRDDVIKMAREAGFEIESNDSVCCDYGTYNDEIGKFAALVAAAERDACAQVCEDWDTSLADAIRARGQL